MIQLLALIILVTTHATWCTQENQHTTAQQKLSKTSADTGHKQVKKQPTAINHAQSVKSASEPVITLQSKSKKQTAKKIKKQAVKDGESKKRRRGDLRKTIKPAKRISELSYTEIKAKRDTCLANNDKEMAFKYAEKMIPMCGDLTELSALTLDTADLLYSIPAWEKAGKMYAQFAQLYPGDKKVEYASYQAINCNYKLIYDAEHDQTRTRETIDLCENFLKKTTFTTYKHEVAGILTQCYQRLFDHEKTVITFYMGQGKLKSAQTRLANVRKEFIKPLPACEKAVLELEIECAMKMNNTGLASEKSLQLATRFPESTTQVAQETSKKPALEKF